MPGAGADVGMGHSLHSTPWPGSLCKRVVSTGVERDAAARWAAERTRARACPLLPCADGDLAASQARAHNRRRWHAGQSQHQAQQQDGAGGGDVRPRTGAGQGLRPRRRLVCAGVTSSDDSTSAPGQHAAQPPQNLTPATLRSSRSADSTSSMPAKGSRLSAKPTAGREGVGGGRRQQGRRLTPFHARCRRDVRVRRSCASSAVPCARTPAPTTPGPATPRAAPPRPAHRPS